MGNKKFFIGMLIGMIITSTASVAASSYVATKILYTNSNGETTNVNDAINCLYDTANAKIKSYVGMIIYSASLESEDQVKKIYDGEQWQKIQGRFLLGDSDTHEINSVGGEEQHTLTVNEMPSHTHMIGLAKVDQEGYVPKGSKNFTSMRYNSSVYSPFINGTPTDRSINDISNTTFNQTTGGSQPHNNMPPYKTVYIWQRIK